MTTLILVIHVMIALALIGVVLLQRSEGGALGIGGGGGGGGGGLMSGRGAANLLTRTTAVLAASFMATSIILAILAGGGERRSVLERTPADGAAPVNALEPGIPEGGMVLPGGGGAAPMEPAGPVVPVGD